MEFEWDSAKRLANIAKHGLDFLAARSLFDGRASVTLPSTYATETRLVSTAIMDDGKFYSVIWTLRGECRRIISYRRARDGERREYRQVYG